MGKAKPALFLFFLFLGLVLLPQSFRVEAQTAGLIVTIDPEQHPSVGIGNNFTIYVRVEDVQQLQGAQVQFTYDPMVLNATQVAEGPFLLSGGYPTAIAQLYAEVDNEAQPPTGEVFYASSIMGPPVSGSGILLNVTFSVISDAASRLHLLPYQRVPGYPGTFFLDVNFVEMVPSAQNLRDGFYGSPISLSAKPDIIDVGDITTLSGSLYGPSLGLVSSVNIEYSTTGGNWTTLAALPANTSGFFTYQWSGNESNEYLFRVYYTYQNETASSQTVVVTVQPIAVSHLNYVYYALVALVVIAAAATIISYIRKRRAPEDTPAPM
jgi:hypothetical protein